MSFRLVLKSSRDMRTGILITYVRSLGEDMLISRNILSLRANIELRSHVELYVQT